MGRVCLECGAGTASEIAALCAACFAAGERPLGLGVSPPPDDGERGCLECGGETASEMAALCALCFAASNRPLDPSLVPAPVGRRSVPGDGFNAGPVRTPRRDDPPLALDPYATGRRRPRVRGEDTVAMLAGVSRVLRLARLVAVGVGVAAVLAVVRTVLDVVFFAV